MNKETNRSKTKTVEIITYRKREEIGDSYWCCISLNMPMEYVAIIYVIEQNLAQNKKC